jgi:hypothetical protein
MRTFNRAGLLIIAMVCHATSMYGQQSQILDPPTPQTTPVTQNTDALQDSQARDLQDQPGLFDETQGGQTGNPNQSPGQLETPQQYDQRGGIDRGATAADRSMMRDMERQPGQMGSQHETGIEGAGRPGELGVFLVDANGPGVMIRQTVAGSAAAEAGLEPGDVILEINGQGVDAPQQVTRLIRAIPGGQSVQLIVWRDGAEQQIATTLQPAGQQRRVGFRGSETAAMSGDLNARTRRLEQQLAMVMQELRQLREEVRQLNTGRARTPLDQTQIDTSAPQPNATQRGLEAIPQTPTEPGNSQIPGLTPPAENDTGLPF